MKSTQRSSARSPKEGPLPIDSRARSYLRIATALLLMSLGIFMAKDFLVPIGWAMILAITLWPLYDRFSKLFPTDHRDLAPPLLFTGLTGLILFLPVAMAMHRVTQEGLAIAESISQFRQTGVPAPDWLPSVPGGGHILRWWQVNLSDAKAAGEWLGAADSKNDAAVTRAVGADVLHRLFLFFVALMVLFSLLRHGPWFARRSVDTADRLLGDPGERLASKIVDAIRATVAGTVIVAVTEGALIGAAYFLAGFPNALLFTVLTMAFAMLPFGAWAMFTAASILFVMQGGSFVIASAVFGFGALVMIVGDTLFWPAVVGNSARLPFLVALIGIFGGLQAFGLIGLFLGPVIMVAIFTVWREWIIHKG